MSYAIGIFSEREHGSGVQEVLLSISWNDSKNTESHCPGYNEYLLFANEINFVVHTR